MASRLVTFYTSFKGRATRYDFNVKYALVMFLGTIVAAFADYALAGGNLMAAAQNNPVSLFWNLLVIWPTLAVTARRLHDLNQSGWFQIIIYGLIVFSVGEYMAIALAPNTKFPQARIMIACILGLLGLIWLALLSVKRGTKGPNKYGDDPLEKVT